MLDSISEAIEEEAMGGFEMENRAVASKLYRDSYDNIFRQ